MRVFLQKRRAGQSYNIESARISCFGPRTQAFTLIPVLHCGYIKLRNRNYFPCFYRVIEKVCGSLGGTSSWEHKHKVHAILP
jgi:hypothetical protein